MADLLHLDTRTDPAVILLKAPWLILLAEHILVTVEKVTKIC
jgi:hypothetical protein